MASHVRRRAARAESKHDESPRRAREAEAKAKADEYEMTDSEDDEEEEEPSSESVRLARLALGGLGSSSEVLFSGEPPAWLAAFLKFAGPRFEALLGFLEDAYDLLAPFVHAFGATTERIPGSC